jgi:hypothetical protein
LTFISLEKLSDIGTRQVGDGPSTKSDELVVEIVSVAFFRRRTKRPFGQVNFESLL